MRQIIISPLYSEATYCIHEVMYLGNRIKCNKYTAKHDAAILFTQTFLNENLVKANSKNKEAPIINRLLYCMNIVYNGYISKYINNNIPNAVFIENRIYNKKF